MSRAAQTCHSKYSTIFSKEELSARGHVVSPNTTLLPAHCRTASESELSLPSALVRSVLTGPVWIRKGCERSPPGTCSSDCCWHVGASELEFPTS